MGSENEDNPFEIFESPREGVIVMIWTGPDGKRHFVNLEPEIALAIIDKLSISLKKLLSRG